MSLLWADGYRYGGAAKYDSGSSFSIGATSGYNNGLDSWGAFMSSGGMAKTIPARDEIIFGYRWYLNPSLDRPDRTPPTVYEFWEGTANKHVVVTVDWTTLELIVANGSGAALGRSLPVASSKGEWVYLEGRALIDDTAGEVELRAYGNVIYSETGLDTKNGGTGLISRGYLIPHLAGLDASFRYDDYYILDRLGTTNNDFLCTTTYTPTVFDLAPSGLGDVNDFAVTGAASNWEALSSADGDTSYVSSDVVGAKDLYQLPDLPVGANSIAGVVQWAQWRKDDAGMRSAALTLRSGGVDSDGATVSLTNTHAGATRVVETDPASGVAFTPSDINAIQIGMTVVE